MAKNFKTLQSELDSRPGAAERQTQAAETEMFAQLGLYQLRIERQQNVDRWPTPVELR